jgi:hypothetical protein
MPSSTSARRTGRASSDRPLPVEKDSSSRFFVHQAAHSGQESQQAGLSCRWAKFVPSLYRWFSELVDTRGTWEWLSPCGLMRKNEISSGAASSHHARPKKNHEKSGGCCDCKKTKPNKNGADCQKAIGSGGSRGHRKIHAVHSRNMHRHRSDFQPHAARPPEGGLSAALTIMLKGQTKRWSVLLSAIRHETDAVAIDAGSGKKSPGSGSGGLFDVWLRA